MGVLVCLKKWVIVSQSAAPQTPLILIVDDEWMNREMLQAILESEGFEVLLAASGQKTLELVAARLPDLILLDVRMPGLSGYEVCKRLKTAEATRHIPIIMLTGLDNREELPQAREAGADGILSKPLDNDLLLKRITELLHR